MAAHFVAAALKELVKEKACRAFNIILLFEATD
jgi:hypothetical protein